MEEIMRPVFETSNLSAMTIKHWARRALLPVAGVFALATVVLAGEREAKAQVIEVAPPAVQVEVVPAAPAVEYVWTPGYWGWRPGRGHVWVAGRYVVARPGYAWFAPHWAHRGRYYHFVPGRWHRR
jgi:hypothetical protein